MMRIAMEESRQNATQNIQDEEEMIRLAMEESKKQAQG